MAEPLGPELVAEGQVYRARNPKSSPLWRCLDAHFGTFLDIYPEVYERAYCSD